MPGFKGPPRSCHASRRREACDLSGRTPSPPADLVARGRGRRFWKSVLTEFEASPSELELLAEACRTLDELRRAVERDGAIVTGSVGQPRRHPALTEARQQRAELRRLLDVLGIPAPLASAAEAEGVVSIATRRATRAVRARWERRGASWLEVVDGGARVEDVLADLRERAERSAWLAGRPSAHDLGRLERLEAGRAVLVETGELAGAGLPAGRWWELRADGSVVELAEDEGAVVEAVVFAWQVEDVWKRQGGEGRPPASWSGSGLPGGKAAGRLIDLLGWTPAGEWPAAATRGRL